MASVLVASHTERLIEQSEKALVVMARRENIEVGQRYVATESSVFGAPPRAIWLVAYIRRATDGVLCANLVNEKQTNRKKTIAVDALGDPRLYRVAPRDPSNLQVSASVTPGAEGQTVSQRIFGSRRS